MPQKHSLKGIPDMRKQLQAEPKLPQQCRDRIDQNYSLDCLLDPTEKLLRQFKSTTEPAFFPSRRQYGIFSQSPAQHQELPLLLSHPRYGLFSYKFSRLPAGNSPRKASITAMRPFFFSNTEKARQRLARLFIIIHAES